MLCRGSGTVAHTCDLNILETEAKVANNKASLGYIVRPVKTNRTPPYSVVRVKMRFAFLQLRLP